eukprot:1306588-Prorocentrum_lima.AAC.1
MALPPVQHSRLGDAGAMCVPAGTVRAPHVQFVLVDPLVSHSHRRAAQPCALLLHSPPAPAQS